MKFKKPPKDKFGNLQIFPENFEPKNNEKVFKPLSASDVYGLLECEASKETINKLMSDCINDSYSICDNSTIECSLPDEAIQYYRSLADENGELTLSCVCDSTLLYAWELYKLLDLSGVTDIKVESREATPEEIPKDKPYCSWYYSATGRLPKE